MYMLNNFINIFQILYRGFTCIIKSVQSAFTIKTFCMQKQNVKTFMFMHHVRKECAGFIENLLQ